MPRISAQRADPVTTEIIRNTCISCAQEMNSALIRSAHSPIIYEGKDCSCALLDESARVIGQSDGLPLFLSNLEECVLVTARKIGWDSFRDGDVFFLNDSYLTGAHLNDATIFAPIFWIDQLVGFAVTRAHWIDVGSKDTGGSMDSTEIFQEGIRFGPTRLAVEGEAVDDVIDVIARNSRFPEDLLGDLNAQIAACKLGSRRFQTILDRYSYPSFCAARDEFFRQTDRLDRAAIRSIPDGVYAASGTLDDDGRGHGPLPIAVRITCHDDQLHVDLAGTSPQAEGPINCGRAQTVSAVRVAFKLLISPDRPADGGSYQSLTVSVPSASLLDAKPPAPCYFYWTPLGLLIDLIIRALSPVLPTQAAAAHYGDGMIMRLFGVDPRTDERFLMTGPHPGGWGASICQDGEDALINIANGAFKDYPIEVIEKKYPIVVREYAIRADSGGAGRYRGGCGIIKWLEPLVEVRTSLWFERSVTPAWGLDGGSAGASPEVIVHRRDGTCETFLKATALPLLPGDALELRTGGGGGWGDPMERPPELALGDVQSGYISPQVAEAVYGLVLSHDGIDIDRTVARRAARRTSRQSAIQEA